MCVGLRESLLARTWPLYDGLLNPLKVYGGAKTGMHLLDFPVVDLYPPILDSIFWG